MSQYSHDEFDDVPPYQSDEVGKHRAPGSAVASGASGGGLKWIGLLAAFALIVGLVAYFGGSWLRGEDEPVAEEEQTQDEQTQDEQPADEDEAEPAPEGEEGESPEEEQPEEGAEADLDFPIYVYNYDGTPGVAGSVRTRLEGAGFNVTGQDNWSAGWNTCGETAPVVVHPPAQEAVAARIAEELGAATCASDGWTDAGVIAVAVGVESAQ